MSWFALILSFSLKSFQCACVAWLIHSEKSLLLCCELPYGEVHTARN